MGYRPGVWNHIKSDSSWNWELYVIAELLETAELSVTVLACAN